MDSTAFLEHGVLGHLSSIHTMAAEKCDHFFDLFLTELMFMMQSSGVQPAKWQDIAKARDVSRPCPNHAIIN